MQTFFFFGTYTEKSIKSASKRRTKVVKDLIKKMGGNLISIYGLFGEWDLVIIVELPDMNNALELSTSLFKLTDISFETHPAFEVETLDRLITKK